MTTDTPGVAPAAVLPILQRHLTAALTQAAVWEALASESQQRAEQAEHRAEQAEQRAAAAEVELEQLRAVPSGQEGGAA